ncbi:MAG: serine/threonine-protein kinase [Pirellulales bacterium]
MSTTTFPPHANTMTLGGGDKKARCPSDLLDRYQALIDGQPFNWTVHHHLLRKLGEGGQGTVFLSERRGTDNFTLPVALKVFSPERFETARAYDECMARMAAIAARVAQIQQDNLIDVHNFVDRSRIRLMEMEWVDGYDLERLMSMATLDRVRHRVSVRRWDYLNNVIVTAGSTQPRLKPGIAIAVLRECLAGLAALHRQGIVHGDLKPSNIMLKRTGNAKIIDIGSAFDLDDAPSRRSCTPAYAAPEVLEEHDSSPRSDLASLGYVLVEMLSGQRPFAGLSTLKEYLEAKRMLVQRLHTILPAEVVCNELLMNLCRGLIAPDPMRRFPNAEAADLVKEGAASFHRQLVKGDLASEYENEIRLWLEELD